MSATSVDADEILVKLLDEFSQNALKKIAQTLGIANPSADRQGYLRTVASFVGTPRHLEILRGRLSERHWGMLSLLPLRAGPVRLRSLFTLLNRAGAEPGDELNALGTLMAHGCLFPATEGVGSQRLNIDAGSLRNVISNRWFEVPPAVRRWIQQRYPDTFQLAPVDPPAAVEANQLDQMRRGAYLLLSEAAAHPIKLTTTGVPYKTELTRLTAVLAGTTIPKGAKAKAAAPPPPPILWFLLSALLGADVLGVVEQKICPSPNAEQFQSAPPERQIAILLSGWIRGIYDDLARVPTLMTDYGASNDVLWVDPTPYDDVISEGTRLSSARAFLSFALSFGLRGAPDAWYDVDEFAAFVHDSHPDFLFDLRSDYELLNPKLFNRAQRGQRLTDPYPGIYRAPDPANRTADLTLYPDRDWPLVEGAFVRQIVAEPLLWLGLVEVDANGTDLRRFRLTPLARHLFYGQPLPAQNAARDVLAAVVVQPNFDVVVVDALANTGILAQLDVFAERRSLDRAATYHLSQDALLRGLDRGWTGPRILATLVALNRGPLPQNVQYTLQEWIGLYERLTLRENVTLLDADSPAQLDSWLAIADVASLLGRRLGSTSILIPVANLDRVSAFLKKTFRNNRVIDYSQPRHGVVEVRDPDLIVASAPDFYLDYRLRAFCAPIAGSDSEVTYRITAESVRQARLTGRSGQDLIEFLQSAAMDALPPDVTARLLGWSGAIVPLVQQTVVAVYLASSAVNWWLLTAIPSIGPLIQNVLSPKMALVTFDNLEPLRAALAERGVTIQSGTLPPDEQRPAGAFGFAPFASLLLDEKNIASILGEEINRLGDVDLPWPIFRLKTR